MTGYKDIGYYIIFDVKMDEKFTQKSRLVAIGHETEYVPKWDTYFSVVIRDSTRISLLYAALNGVDIMSCEIYNTYIEAQSGEKPWTVSGKEFVSLAGTPMRINRELYRIKSTGTYWHNALFTTLSNINFEPSRADSDIWLRMSTNSRRDMYRE